MTGHYSAVNWYRCVSHCSAAKELLLCLFVYQLLSQKSRCVSRRNQILRPNLPRWQARKTRRGEKSTRTSKMESWIRNNKKKQIRTPSPPLTYFFGENSAIELDFFGRLRKVKDELLVWGGLLPLSRLHAQKLLFVHFLSLSLLEVTGIETCAQQTRQWQHAPTPHSQAVTNGGKGANPPWQTRCRNWDSQSGSLGYSILLGFSTMLFSFSFLVYFPGI